MDDSDSSSGSLLERWWRFHQVRVVERVGSPPGAWESEPAGHVLKVLAVIRPYLVLFPKASVPYSSRGHCSSRTYNLSGGVLFPTNWPLLSITSQRHHIRNP